MDGKVEIHTRISPSSARKLKNYGDGRINDGIETVIALAELKQYDTKNELIRIANKILNEVNTENL